MANSSDINGFESQNIFQKRFDIGSRVIISSLINS